MDKNNPWRLLPHETYEKHMGHDKVRQLEALSRVFGGQLALVAEAPFPIRDITATR